LGEYGSIVFVSGNMPFKTEIAPFLIVSRLEEGGNKVLEATALATVLLAASLLMLVLINRLEAWSRRG
jgi:sulfate transport system permease protein